MSVLRCIYPSFIKRFNGYVRISWLRSCKQWLIRFLRSFRDAILHKFLPTGYEDEEGFHYSREEDGSESGSNSK